MENTLTRGDHTRWHQRLLHAGWIDGPALNFFLEEINPRWSLIETRAVVREVIEETHDTKSFVLKPGWGWRRFKPGQHIGVCVEIDGIQHRRRYSISSAPVTRRRDPITITVKREPGGRVSEYMHQHIRTGDILGLSAPEGDFVLPSPCPDSLLMLAAGSGITPLMGQLRSLLAQGYAGQVTLLHYVRSEHDRIFGKSLEALVEQHPGLTVRWCLERPPGGHDPHPRAGFVQGRFSPEQLTTVVPDFFHRHTLLCGPPGFMTAVRQHFDAQGLTAQLQFEYFGSPTVSGPKASQTGANLELTLLRSGKQIRNQAGRSLLEALESAGEQPAYGCRQGICQSCRCLKRSGEVRNLLTGTLSREPDEEIQLCISSAESPLSLDY